MLDAGAASVEALNEAEVQTADIFSTDTAVRKDDLVRLNDPQAVFKTQHIVPLVYRPGIDQTVRTTLNEVSARLTQAQLFALNDQLALGVPPVTVAERRLEEVGLG